MSSGKDSSLTEADREASREPIRGVGVALAGFKPQLSGTTSGSANHPSPHCCCCLSSVSAPGIYHPLSHASIAPEGKDERQPPALADALPYPTSCRRTLQPGNPPRRDLLFG
jgi:hypothetical protein